MTVVCSRMHPLTWPGWFWNSRKSLNQSRFTYWAMFGSTILPRNQGLGASLLSSYSWLSLALDLARMVQDFQKKTSNQSSFTYWTIFVTTTLPRIQALGMSLLWANTWLQSLWVRYKVSLYLIRVSLIQTVNADWQCKLYLSKSTDYRE